MSVEVINVVRAHRFGSAARKVVMYVLADYADALWSCFVGQKRLAAESEVGERTVRRMLADLETEGLIRREGRYGGIHGRTSDRIHLVRDAIEALPVTLAASEGRMADLPATDDTLPAKSADLPANGDISTGHSLAGEPSVEPLVLDPSGEPSGRARASKPKRPTAGYVTWKASDERYLNSTDAQIRAATRL